MQRSLLLRERVMDYGETLLNEVIENPHDLAPRLIYADWLEEHGDCRGEFIRLQHRMQDMPLRYNRAIVLHLRDRQLRQQIRLPWLRLMQYPLAPTPLDRIDVPSSVLEHVPEHFARRFQIIPLRCDGKRLWLAMGIAGNLQIEDDLRNLLGYRIEMVGAWDLEIPRALDRFYPLAGLLPPGASPSPPALPETLTVAPLDISVEQLVQRAVNESAVEIHLEPMRNYFRVRFRFDRNGMCELQEQSALPVQMGGALLSQAKMLALLEVDNRSFPQHGVAEIIVGQQCYHVTVSTLPTVNGESAVLTLAPHLEGNSPEAD